MPKKNDFKLDVVSVRLVKDAPIYSEHTFNNPADIAAERTAANSAAAANSARAIEQYSASTNFWTIYSALR